MLPFQLAGRNIQVLEWFTPLGQLFGEASQTTVFRQRKRERRPEKKQCFPAGVSLSARS
jgi:hypothetical protein